MDKKENKISEHYTDLVNETIKESKKINLLTILKILDVVLTFFVLNLFHLFLSIFTIFFVYRKEIL